MSSRPNILFITTDQQRFDTLSMAADNPHIYTPHLDWLTQNGICFDRAYADAPICVPSRNTIMTGLTGYTTGRHHMGPWQGGEPAANNPTLPGLLTQAGYQTKAVGKMHFHPMRAHFGFEHIELPADYMRTMARHPEKGRPMDHGVGQNESVPVFSTVSESNSLTHWTVERSINFLETRDSTRPFFLWTSFTKPHAPYDCQKEYWDLYDGMDIPEPITGEWSHDPEHIAAGWMEPTWMLNANHRDSKQKLMASRRAYYACVTQVDYNLGLLFAHLCENQLMENTWIIFTTDHGDMLGDHHMGAKHIHLESSAHIPMLIRSPGPLWDPDNSFKALHCDKLVQLADILPTVLNLAGVTLPEKLDGVDLLKTLSGDTKERDHLYGRSENFHMLRDKRYKYLFCSAGGSELLFDLKNDPQEQCNLATRADMSVELLRLRQLMAEYLLMQNEPLKDGLPTSAKSPRSEKEVARTRMPGFHSTLFPCDVLH